MITERVMPIAMFLFFIMIGINGFIAVSGQLSVGNGQTLDQFTTQSSDELGSDMNSLSKSIAYSPSSPDSASDNADAGFSLFTIAGNIWNGVVSGATNLVENTIGVKNLNLLENMLVGIEKYMAMYSEWFPEFAAIFNSIIFFAFAIKIVVIGYAGSVLVRTLVGRRL